LPDSEKFKKFEEFRTSLILMALKMAPALFRGRKANFGEEDDGRTSFVPVVGKHIPSHSAKNPFSIPIFEGSGTEERSTNYY
jgi:hypothetical protein